jgi:hypothetical protein
MRIHNIYADADGVSHFRDVEVEWIERVRASDRSAVIPATGIQFRRTEADFSLGWHAAPRRQFMINLDAAVEITVGDGETRVVHAGEVVLVEDITGKGHVSRSVADQLRHSILVHC